MEKRQTEEGSRGQRLVLRLYVAGDAPNSVRAVANLKAICRRWLGTDQYELENIDVLREPLRALEDGVLVTPTLVGVGRGDRLARRDIGRPREGWSSIGA